MYPRFIRPMHALRSLMPRFLDRAIDGDMVGRLIDELDERDLVRGDSGDPSREFHERVLANSEADRYDRRSEEESDRLLS
jgi:hypothetical protein